MIWQRVSGRIRGGVRPGLGWSCCCGGWPAAVAGGSIGPDAAAPAHALTALTRSLRGG